MFNENYFINRAIEKNAPMSNLEIWESEISCFLASKELKAMKDGIDYYHGRHKILRRRRTAIGENGNTVFLDNLPNNRIVDNQYRKAVVQKSNYFLGKPFLVECDNKVLASRLGCIFNKAFHRLLKNIVADCFNCGIGWLYLFYDRNGRLSFKRFAPTEIVPIWKDAEHTELDSAIRIYDTVFYQGVDKNIVTKVEVYSVDGIRYFVLENGKLLPDGDCAVKTEEAKCFNAMPCPYITNGNRGFNWDKIPLIAFKRNNEEMPLIKNVKTLQDALNCVLSDFANNMQEDARNTILVIKNYDGENLAEFRQNLAAFGAVKVRTVDGADAGVSTLHVDVNADNYKQLAEILKRAIVENAMGFDAKNDRMSSSPNQMNIQSMYSDIDLDTNETEIEFQAAMEQLLFFIFCHFCNIGEGNFENESVNFIFDRDMLMNEAEIIDSVVKSADILSRKTLLANHPYVKDVNRELERLESN